MNVVLAEVFPAGEFLADELDARGWTQAEFAAILDRPAQFVSEIISGKKEITRESAAQIGAALGTSAEMPPGPDHDATACTVARSLSSPIATYRRVVTGEAWPSSVWTTSKSRSSP